MIYEVSQRSIQILGGGVPNKFKGGGGVPNGSSRMDPKQTLIEITKLNEIESFSKWNLKCTLAD